MRTFIVLLLFSGFFFSCNIGVQSRISLTGTKKYPSLKKEQLIKAYLNDDYVPNFEEIGILEVYYTGFSYIFLEEAVNEAKRKAALYGADCIILIRDFYKYSYLAPLRNVLYFRIGIKG